MILKKINHKQGFSLIETMIYIFISAMLLLMISSLIMSIFNARKQLYASNIIHYNARFVINFLSNRIHNVDLIDDVSPAPEGFHFYQLPDIRFSVDLEGDDLIYREVQDVGQGFPEQLSAVPMILNSDRIVVSDLIITTVNDAHGNPDQGIKIDFTLTVDELGDNFGYIQKSFSTFLSIR